MYHENFILYVDLVIIVAATHSTTGYVAKLEFHVNDFKKRSNSHMVMFILTSWRAALRQLHEFLLLPPFSQPNLSQPYPEQPPDHRG